MEFEQTSKEIAVKEFSVPKTQKNAKQFLGLAEYYRRFIEGFSKIVNHPNQLLKRILRPHGTINNK